MDGEKNEERCSRELSNEEQEQADWDDYFMATASLAAKRSKDPCSQVGACIANRKNIVLGVGYNGMPMGCSDDEFPWAKKPNSLENKHLYVCHAELNAFVNTYSMSVKDAVIYVTLFPCNECSKLLIQAGITEVVYLSDKHKHKISTIASKHMLQTAGIKVRQFIPRKKEVVIDFTAFNDNSMPGPSTSENNDEINQIVAKTAQCQI